MPERAEPTLDPVPSEPVEPHVEPVIVAEEPEPETEENEAAVPDAFEPELVIEDDIVIPESEEGEAEPEDEEVLGEEREAVQKSRRKRPMPRRRPERLRTARRRE
jgi:hypothetical protein